MTAQDATTPDWHLLRRVAPSAESLSKQLSDWDDLPVLPFTQLRLELALISECPSLRELTCTLREDPVAVLRLFALAASVTEAPLVSSSEDPLRLENLVVMLGKQDLLQAFCQQSPVRDAQAASALAFAQQASAVGRLCRTLAATMGLPAEEAYVIGLLHAIGSLPVQLGSVSPKATMDPRSVLSALCRRYALPTSLRRALEEVHRQQDTSPWTAVVRAAYELLAANSPGRAFVFAGASLASPWQNSIVRIS